MIITGVILIGIGWALTPTQTTEIQTEVESLISEITNPATPTTLVIVLPNCDDTTAQAPIEKIAPAAPVAPITPAAQVPAGAPIWVSNPTNQQDLSAFGTQRSEAGTSGSEAAAQKTATYAPVITVTATASRSSVRTAPDSTKVEVDTFPTAAAGPIMVVTATKIQEGEMNQNQNVSGHCTEWTNDEKATGGECHSRTATPAPTYVPPTTSAAPGTRTTPLEEGVWEPFLPGITRKIVRQ